MKKTLSLLLIFLSWDALAAPAFVPRLMGRQALKHPIVLVHGATTNGSQLRLGFINFGDYFRRIVPYYEATGTKVYVAQLTTDGSIGERAAVLKNFLQTELKGQMVNIVAHSLGGLDARYAASILGAGQIASITTIGTPHKGSPLADWAVRQQLVSSPWYWFFRLLGYDLAGRRFLNEITTQQMELNFNPKVKNLPEVKYYSVGALGNFETGTMSFLLWFPARWLEGEHHFLSSGGHDGMVPTNSMHWGKELGDYNLDHLGQINHHELRFTDQQDVALQMYSRIYDNLYSEGL